MKGPKRATDEFYGFTKSRKRSLFEFDSYLNDSAFTVVKREAKQASKVCKKGYHLSIGGIRKGYVFCQKWYIKG